MITPATLARSSKTATVANIHNAMRMNRLIQTPFPDNEFSRLRGPSEATYRAPQARAARPAVFRSDSGCLQTTERPRRVKRTDAGIYRSNSERLPARPGLRGETVNRLSLG